MSEPKITLPDNIKEEVRKNVKLLKVLLKDDKEFANTIINNLSLLKSGKGYCDTFTINISIRYPDNGDLIRVVDDLAYFIVGEHELAKSEIDNWNYDEKPLCEAIEKEIIETFNSSN